MNVSVRRHGIVVQTVRVTGDRAKIGSAEGCEVRLADPLIAPLVAEFVGRGGIWRIVDAGTDPIGIQRDDIQIFDEVLEPGTTYKIGAFELTTDANPARKLTQATSILDDDDLPPAPTLTEEGFPMTMVQADLGDSPATVIQDFDEIRTPAKSAQKPRNVSIEIPAPGKLVFQKSEKPAEPPPPLTRPRSKRDIAMFAGVAAAVILVTVIGVRFAFGPSARISDATTGSQASPAPSPQATIEEGDQFARDLQFGNALDSWESAAGRANDPRLRAKITNGAFELGRGYAAAKDDANARKYFQKVVKYGDAASAPVGYAKQYLAAK